jgi:Flp pilus assembly protein TadB
LAKFRARRRAERDQRIQAAQAKEARRQAWRRKRRAVWRRATLHELRHRSSGSLLAKRSRAQRAVIAVFILVALFVIWWGIASTALSVALTILLVLAVPVLVIVAFDKRSA